MKNFQNCGNTLTFNVVSMATKSPILKERVDFFRDKKDDNSEKLQATVIKFQPCSKVKVTVMSFS